MKRLLFALALVAAPLGAAPLDLTTATIAEFQSAMAKGTLT
jgi:hypothetical protein